MICSSPNAGLPYGKVYLRRVLRAIAMTAGPLWLGSSRLQIVESAALGSGSGDQAVYIDKRELKCACVGGSSNVPLGFVIFFD